MRSMEKVGSVVRMTGPDHLGLCAVLPVRAFDGPIHLRRPHQRPGSPRIVFCVARPCIWPGSPRIVCCVARLRICSPIHLGLRRSGVRRLGGRDGGSDGEPADGAALHVRAPPHQRAHTLGRTAFSPFGLHTGRVAFPPCRVLLSLLRCRLLDVPLSNLPPPRAPMSRLHCMLLVAVHAANADCPPTKWA